MADSRKDIYNLSLNISDSNFRSVFSGFLKNDHHTFVVQKTEKLASALYLITGYMSVEEPLRTKLRTCALDLVSSVADAGHASDELKHFGPRCLEIGTILRLSERAGLVSPMNAKILCEEYAELASFVRDHFDKIFGAHVVRDGANVPVHERVAGQVPESIGRPLSNRTNNSKRHSNRQEIIIGLFSTKDTISIKDAVSAIEGCSEKTIQREIMSLVDEGVLVKEGKRRWSRYRKAQNSL
jgi:hypothetical protein